MPDLTADWLPILEAIRLGETAWTAPDDLVQRLGCDREATLDALAALHLAGWLEAWEPDSGLLITLSPLAAARLGAHLVERGGGRPPRWSRPDERPARGPGAGAGPARWPDPVGALPDPRPGPSEPGRDGPTRLVGVNLCPWPGPRRFRAAPCPACGGEPLVEGAYCLGCDRLGPTATRPPATRPAARRAAGGA